MSIVKHSKLWLMVLLSLSLQYKMTCHIAVGIVYGIGIVYFEKKNLLG